MLAYLPTDTEVRWSCSGASFIELEELSTSWRSPGSISSRNGVGFSSESSPSRAAPRRVHLFDDICDPLPPSFCQQALHLSDRSFRGLRHLFVKQVRRFRASQEPDPQESRPGRKGASVGQTAISTAQLDAPRRIDLNSHRQTATGIATGAEYARERIQVARGRSPLKTRRSSANQPRTRPHAAGGPRAPATPGHIVDATTLRHEYR